MSKNIFGENTIKVSAKWATKEIACTMPFIATNCGGACCKGTSYWPSKANGDVCAHLGDKGCKLAIPEKPVTCLLYPFVIKNETLVLHGRALLACCKSNYKIGGKSIWEQNEGNLTTLFGAEQFSRVLKEIKAGRDTYLEITDEFLEQLEFEDSLEEQNIVPVARTKGNWPKYSLEEVAVLVQIDTLKK